MYTGCQSDYVYRLSVSDNLYTGSPVSDNLYTGSPVSDNLYT